MGQYHLIVNLDKQQYIYPHALGDGLKLGEQGNSVGGSMSGLCLLLAASNKGGVPRGGGDLDYRGPGAELIGSWAGDRIVIAGDYQKRGDLPTDLEIELYGELPPLEGKTGELYIRARDQFEDLAERLRPLLAVFSEVRFTPSPDTGCAFCHRDPADPEDGAVVSMRPDMVYVAGLSQGRCDHLADQLDQVMDSNRDSQGKTKVEQIRAIVRQVRDDLRGQK